MESIEEGNVRVLFTRSLLEGHDIGLRTVVNKCRKSGIEVIYYPRFKAVGEVVKVAEEEDADMIGLSSSSGAHLYLANALIVALREKSMDIPVIMGGVISDKDIPRLKTLGVSSVFGPGSNPEDVVTLIYEIVRKI